MKVEPNITGSPQNHIILTVKNVYCLTNFCFSKGAHMLVYIVMECYTVKPVCFEPVCFKVYNFSLHFLFKFYIFSMFVLKDFIPKPLYFEFGTEVSTKNFKPNDHRLTIEVTNKKYSLHRVRCE